MAWTTQRKTLAYRRTGQAIRCCSLVDAACSSWNFQVESGKHEMPFASDVNNADSQLCSPILLFDCALRLCSYYALLAIEISCLFCFAQRCWPIAILSVQSIGGSPEWVLTGGDWTFSLVHNVHLANRSILPTLWSAKQLPSTLLVNHIAHRHTLYEQLVSGILSVIFQSSHLPNRLQPFLMTCMQ